MKKCLAILLSLAILLFLPTIGEATASLPVAYWQLLDEERYIYRSDLERFNWHEIRKIREQNISARYATKHFAIKTLEASTDIAMASSFEAKDMAQATILIRDPNGMTALPRSMTSSENTVSLPTDDDLIGRYLLGARIPMGEGDVDGDGITESVILCAKHIVSHRKNGGCMGSASVVYFDDAEQMPLEIGPVINTAKSKFGGGTQIPHRSYEMQVNYSGRALPGARVTVLAEGSHWRKTIFTGEDGRFEITPTDDRFSPRAWQKYFYIAAHHDRDKNAYYIATLPIVVSKNRPEWQSKAMGFTYWSIIGTGVSLLMVAVLARRRRKRDQQVLIVFDNQKIRKDLP